MCCAAFAAPVRRPRVPPCASCSGSKCCGSSPPIWCPCVPTVGNPARCSADRKISLLNRPRHDYRQIRHAATSAVRQKLKRHSRQTPRISPAGRLASERGNAAAARCHWSAQIATRTSRCAAQSASTIASRASARSARACLAWRPALKSAETKAQLLPSSANCSPRWRMSVSAMFWR